MPPLPASTAKPASASVRTYQAADRYSRNAGSAKSQIVFVQADRSAAFRSTQSRATSLASDIGHGLRSARGGQHAPAGVGLGGGSLVTTGGLAGCRCLRDQRHVGSGGGVKVTAGRGPQMPVDDGDELGPPDSSSATARDRRAGDR